MEGKYDGGVQREWVANRGQMAVNTQMNGKQAKERQGDQSIDVGLK